MNEPNEEDWPRLAVFIEQRLDALHLQWKDLEARGGPSTAKVRELRNGSSQTLMRSKRRDLERALEWREHSIDAVLSGELPQSLPGSPPAPAAAVAAEFSGTGTPAAVVDLTLLSDEQLIDEIRRRMRGEHHGMADDAKQNASSEAGKAQEVSRDVADDFGDFGGEAKRRRR